MNRALVVAVCAMTAFVSIVSFDMEATASHQAPNSLHPTRVAVLFYDAVPANISQRVSLEGGTLLTINMRLRLAVAENTTATQALLMDRLRGYPDTRSVTADAYGQFLLTPSDEYWDLQWGPGRIGAPLAWDHVSIPAGLKLSIIDTGVDCAHTEFQTSRGSVCDPMSPGLVDSETHGTMVAGIATALVNNQGPATGIAGIAGLSDITIYSASISGPGGYLLLVDGALAIVRSIEAGAQITSMSWGIDCNALPQGTCLPLELAVQEAEASGLLQIAASGNSDCGEMLWPARYAQVVSVSQIDKHDRRYGACGQMAEHDLDLLAPGPEVLSTFSGTDNPVHSVCGDAGPDPVNYCYTVGGTSFAAPHVSGAAALIWSDCPSLTRDELKSFLLEGAEILPEYSFEQQGWGVVRVDRSFEAARDAGKC